MYIHINTYLYIHVYLYEKGRYRCLEHSVLADSSSPLIENGMCRATEGADAGSYFAPPQVCMIYVYIYIYLCMCIYMCTCVWVWERESVYMCVSCD